MKKLSLAFGGIFVVIISVLVGVPAGFAVEASDESMALAKEQVPSWSADDLNVFLHGSMSTEVLPDRALRAC